MKASFLFCLFILNALVISAQEAVVRGVSISEDTLAPHPKALLDVRSINKGVSFPNVSYEEMLLLTPDNASESDLIDGLLVYVSNVDDLDLLKQNSIVPPTTLKRDLRGFYYWDVLADEGNGSWLRITPKKMVYPYGSIIMYSGPMDIFDNMGKGTGEYEGWQICNGNAGSPDMTGMFVVGASATKQEYDSTSLTGGNNFVTLSTSQFPEHVHEMDYSKITSASINIDEINEHTHKIKEEPHKHEFKTVRTEKAGLGKLQAQRSETWTVDAGAFYLRVYKDDRTGREDINIYKEVLKTGKIGSSLPVSLGSQNVFEKFSPEDNQEPIDMRPPHYVVVYLIRLKSNDTYSAVPVFNLDAFKEGN